MNGEDVSCWNGSVIWCERCWRWTEDVRPDEQLFQAAPSPITDSRIRSPAPSTSGGIDGTEKYHSRSYRIFPEGKSNSALLGVASAINLHRVDIQQRPILTKGRQTLTSSLEAWRLFLAARYG